VSDRRPKLIATDLDGTIVPHNGGISRRTIAAFTKARDLGVEIFFVTGRPPRWMGDIREAFDFGSAICCNGGVIYDLHNDKVLEQWMIQPAELQRAVDVLRETIPNVSFAVESNDHFHREKAYIPRWDIGMDDVGVETINTVTNRPALKLLARLSQEEISADEMLALATPVLKGFVNVTHSASNDSLLEISALGVSKGETLAMMAARIGLTADDCVSFGDNPNDFSMLQWTGRSYAMIDGHPAGPANAKDVAPSHKEDGVAAVIEKLLELPQ
jgi:Cof subfamily protein (haloacid dehalogenase superfamily)